MSLGCGFEEMDTNWAPGVSPAPDACYIQVDIDPAEMGRNIVPDIEIVGDVKLVLQDMREARKEAGGPDYRATFRKMERIDELRRMKEALEAGVEVAGREPDTHQRLAGSDGDSQGFSKGVYGGHRRGVSGAGPRRRLPVFQGIRAQVVHTVHQLLCNGLCRVGSPGRKAGYPDRPAIGMCGDGSFQMVMDIMLVAAEYHLPVTWCILDGPSPSAPSGTARTGPSAAAASGPFSMSSPISS